MDILLPRDVWEFIFNLLPAKGVFALQSVSKRLYDCSQKVAEKWIQIHLSRPEFYSKQATKKMLHIIMKRANLNILPDIHRQLWAFEMALLARKPEYINIIKSKFPLTPHMYHICIRLIQEVVCDRDRRVAAEFLQFLESKGITIPHLPKPIKGKSVDEIIAVWFAVEKKGASLGGDDDVSFQFCKLAGLGKVEECRRLIAMYGGRINVNYGNSLPLAMACCYSSLNTVKMLLEQPGINVNSDKEFPRCGDLGFMTNFDVEVDRLPLINASRGRNQQVFRLLLEQPGIDVNQSNDDGETALLCGIEGHNLAMVESLLQYPGINVNLANNMGETPLMRASRSITDSVQLVTLLLASPGINVNATNNRGQTAFMMACSHNNQSIITMLLAHPDIDLNPTSLCDQADGNTLGLLLRCPGIDLHKLVEMGCGGKALVAASQCGLMEIVAALLTYPEIDVNQRDHCKNTALILACGGGHFDIVQLLLQHPNLKLNLGNNGNRTALIQACENGHANIVALLLRQPEIYIDHTDNWGKSAFMFIASSLNNKEMIDLLLAHSNADLYMTKLCVFASADVLRYLLGRPEFSIKQLIRHGHDGTVLVRATELGCLDIVLLLLQKYGVDVNKKNNQGDSALMMASVLRRWDILKMLLNYPGIDVNHKGTFGTAFNRAFLRRDLETAELLLKHPGFDIKQLNTNGSTALIEAAREGNVVFVKLLLSLPGVNINQTNWFGTTALIAAVERDRLDIVKLLLEHTDTRVNHKDDTGSTALSAAFVVGNLHMVKLLLEDRRVTLNVDAILATRLLKPLRLWKRTVLLFSILLNNRTKHRWGSLDQFSRSYIMESVKAAIDKSESTAEPARSA